MVGPVSRSLQYIVERRLLNWVVKFCSCSSGLFRVWTGRGGADKGVKDFKSQSKEDTNGSVEGLGMEDKYCFPV